MDRLIRSASGPLCALALALVPAAAAADDGSVTVVGEVVDTTCYLLHDGRGPGHKDCAVACAQGGTPAALLDDKTGHLVFALGTISKEMHHAHRPDEALLPYVGDRVKVRGRLVERGGVRAIVIDAVERAAAAAAPKR